MTKKMIALTAATLVVLAGVGSYARTSSAAAAAEDADADASPKAVQTNAWTDGAHGWGKGHHHHHWMMAHKDLGLFYPVADKELSDTDVQTIAQAMLLRHGNHTWKVANVARNQDNTVSFAFTTADGGVVAKFAIDTRTGRLHRIG
jgi:hypothetical protein